MCSHISFSACLGKSSSIMPEGNHSVVTEFILTGFPGLHPKYQGLASAVLFLVYSLTLIGNATIVFLFVIDCSLHKPMYYIILNLSACDILFSTTTLPKIISKYWFQSETISFTACFVQMYFVHYLGTVNSYILFLMALDRYLAICHPLRYSLVLKKSTICILSIIAWIVANAGSLMLVIRAYPLPYCASNIINHCYCDHIGITMLACTDRAPYGFPAFILAMVMLLGPLSFIIFSYCCIIIAVLKIANLQGRLKSLSTCSTQLIVISLYYFPRCFVYLASNVGIKFSADMRVVIIMLYSLCPPMINPLIYCLRSKDMRESLWKQLNKRTVSQKTQVSAVSA
ncbi:olfactory receptor 13C2-like [Trachinotus anak]|uniref:olfactory receptor 13C2-like n=1 Tax=Trachinotus anak TaxID=443729 RepID=UPI0039F21863